MRSQMRTRRALRCLAFLGLAGACSCGGGDAAPEAPLAAPAPAPQAAAANRPPRLSALRFEPASPLPGQRVTAHVDAQDPDGDALRLIYTWQLDGQDAHRREASFDVPSDAKGERLEVRVVAHDGQVESAPVDLAVDVGNRPPELVDVLLEPAGGVTVADEIAASARAVDPDGDAVEFLYTWFVNGRRLEVRKPTLTSAHFKRGDEVVLEVRASDGDDESEPLRSSAITIENSLPVVTSNPNGLDATGSFHYTPVVEDADGDRRLRFRLLQAPEGMKVDWLRGTLTWTPSEKQAGKHEVELEVDDGAGGVTTQTFTLDVAFEPVQPQAAPAAAAP